MQRISLTFDPYTSDLEIIQTMKTVCRENNKRLNLGLDTIYNEISKFKSKDASNVKLFPNLKSAQNYYNNLSDKVKFSISRYIDDTDKNFDSFGLAFEWELSTIQMLENYISKNPFNNNAFIALKNKRENFKEFKKSHADYILSCPIIVNFTMSPLSHIISREYESPTSFFKKLSLKSKPKTFELER